MQRVYFLCEGQTEETFVKEFFVTHLSSSAIEAIPLSLRGRTQFDRIKRDIRNTLRNDATAYCTTLIDYYGLPTGFPGKSSANGEPSNKSRIVCDAMTAQIRDLGDNTARRFIPYIQMHEYEALLFSDPASFAQAIGEADKAAALRAIRQAFSTPEHINDSVHTAPSKRIKQLIPAYDKPVAGVIGALDIGLATIRAECPLFDAWLTKIEALAPQS